jgi:hypothetical protein
MFMDAVGGWDLDVSLSKQQTSTMLIIFMGTVVRWVNKPMLYILIMFMDIAVRLVLDVSLSEQQTYAMLIMFIDAAVGWDLDVSLSEQQTCTIYVDNIHGRCSRVDP